MNCGECGRKMIVISANDGVLVYCPDCHPDLDKAFGLGKRLHDVICIWIKKEQK